MPRKAKEKVIDNELINEEIKKSKRSSTKKKVDVVEEKPVVAKTRKTSSKKKVEPVSEEKPVAAKTKKTSSKKKVEPVSEEKPVVTKTKKTSSKKKVEPVSEEKPVAAKTKKTSSKKKVEPVSEEKPVAAKTKKASSKKKAEPVSEEKTIVTKTKKTSSKKKVEPVSEKEPSTTKTKKTSSKTATKTTKTTKTTTKKSTKSKKAPVQIMEYYDLPYKYGNTLVKLLAQTPKTLFVYWEISELDIKNFKEQFGEDFFNITKPILILNNLTLNKTTEIEINDFANCWYLNTEDSDCKFDIELARKFIKPSNNSSIPTQTEQYLHIAKSNSLQAPNDHIMFEKLGDFINFKNTSNGKDIEKNIKSFDFLKDLYAFYQKMYNDELLKNPSSNFNI